MVVIPRKSLACLKCACRRFLDDLHAFKTPELRSQRNPALLTPDKRDRPISEMGSLSPGVENAESESGSDFDDPFCPTVFCDEFTP